MLNRLSLTRIPTRTRLKTKSLPFEGHGDLELKHQEEIKVSVGLCRVLGCAENR